MDPDRLRNHYAIDGLEFGGLLLSVMAAQSAPGAALLIGGATALVYAGRRASWWIDTLLAGADENGTPARPLGRLLLPGPLRADIRDHGLGAVRNALATERATASGPDDLWSLFWAVTHDAAADTPGSRAGADNLPLPGADLPTALTLEALAAADNLLVVGPKGSGKTTLLRQLIGLRRGYHCALDPHNAPGKWPCDVRGGGLAFDAIDQRLHGAFTQMTRRYQALERGEQDERDFQQARVTLIGDEWGAISDELPPTRERLGAGQLLKKLLSQGRKAAICIVAAAHSDTADSLGLHGNMALVQCFDYVVYLGAAATGTLKIPLATRRTAAGMPRPALALDTERGHYHLLTLPDCQESVAASTSPARATPQAQPLLQRLLLENVAEGAGQNEPERRSLIAPQDGFALQRAETAFANAGSARSAVSEEAVSIAEIAQIAILLAQGNAPSNIAKQLPGYAAKRYSVFRAKVDRVLAAMGDGVPTMEQPAFGVDDAPVPVHPSR